MPPKLGGGDGGGAASAADLCALAGGEPNAAGAGRLPNTGGDDVAADGATPPAMVFSVKAGALVALFGVDTGALFGGDDEKKSAVRFARLGGAGDDSAAMRAADAAAA